MSASYRCAACIDAEHRCASCRERRASARRELRAQRRLEGKCIECGRAAAVVDGATRSRCTACGADNVARSGASHAAARKRGASS